MRRPSAPRPCRLSLEPLEGRATPALHTWIGPNNGLWSVAANWSGGAPTAGEPGVQLVFNATSSSSTDDVGSLSVDSIAFNNNHKVTLATPLSLNGGLNFAQIESTSSVVSVSGQTISLFDGTCVFNTGGSGSITIQSNLSGSSGIRTIGSGLVTLRGAADYRGITVVSSGVLLLDNAANASTTLPPQLIEVGENTGVSVVAELRLNSDNQIADIAPVVVGKDGQLNLNGRSEGLGPLFMFGSRVTTGGGSLTLLGDVNVGPGQATIVGNVDLGGGDASNERKFLVDGPNASALVINGTVSGSGTLVLDGGGTLQLAGASGSPNSYGGGTIVRAGTLLLNAAGTDEAVPENLIVGEGTGPAGAAVVRLLRPDQISAAGSVQVGGDGLLDLGGFSDTIAELLLIGGQVMTAAAGAVGVTGVTVALSSPSTARITGNLVLQSAGAQNRFSVEDGPAARDLVIDGRISGTKGLLKDGPGSLEFTGPESSTYTGTTTVADGLLVLNRGGFVNRAVSNDLVIGDSAGGAGTAGVRLLLDNEIPDGAAVTVHADGVLDLNGKPDGIGRLTLDGGARVTTGAGTLVLGDDVVVTAAGAGAPATVTGVLDLGGATRTITAAAGADLRVDAVVANGGVAKAGAGRVILFGANTYGSPTVLNAGVLEIDGTQPASRVAVNGGTLNGVGVVGTLTGTGGVVAPGPGGGPGTLETRSVALGAATYTPDLARLVPGIGGGVSSDVLTVRGTVDLTGAGLAPAPGGFVLPVGRQFVVIVNDGADPVVGTFRGLPEGALLRVGGTMLRVTYQGGDGNDVALTVALPPSPPPPLAVSGSPAGSAVLFTADPAGRYNPSPTATLRPFGNTGADVRVATGDVDGDGFADAVLVTGPGTAIRVVVVSGADNTTLLVAPFDPFGGDFGGGGFVAAGDLDGDGKAEFVVTPDQGGGPRVTVFSRNPDGSRAVRANFLGIDDANFRGGARAALGDVNKDGTPDVVVAAGFGGGPRTAIFTGQSVLAGAPVRLVGDFFAFPGSDAVNLRNGSFVAAGDVTGDGFADLVFGGGPGGAPRVFILSGALVSAGDVSGSQASPVANFFVAGDLSDRGGARVAVTNSDGDGKADVVVGSGGGRPAKVRVYLGKDFTTGGEPAAFQDLIPFGGAVLADGVYVG